VTGTTGSGDWDLLVSPWHLDERLDRFPMPEHAITLDSLPAAAAGPAPAMLEHYRLTADATAGAGRPLVLSGDCLTAVGILAGMQRRHPDVAIVWLDAHGDFNTPQISTSGYLAGMSLAMLTGRSPDPFCRPLGLRPVPDDAVVLIDARDLDAAESDALDASHVARVHADPQAVRTALARLSAPAVYLHVDVDIIDGDELPGLRFPTAAGPSLAQIEECLATILTTVEPAAACISCAWSSQALGDPATHRVIQRIAATLGASLQWRAA
jgi:arginase